MKIYEHVEFR